MGLGAFLDGHRPRPWTAALARFGTAWSRARHDEEHGAEACEPERAAEIVLVRPRPAERAVSAMRVVAPCELARLIAPSSSHRIGGIVLDLTEPTRAMLDLVTDIEESGVGRYVPLIVVAPPGESARAASIAWAVVPCSPGRDASARERAHRMCLALASEDPDSEALGRGALGALHGRLSASTVEATTREAMLVHDLRSPLGVVQGVLALFTEAEAPEKEDPALLHLAARAATDLELIVERLERLYACAGEASRSERVEVAALARGVVGGLRHSAVAREKSLRVSTSGEHWLVSDRQDLVRLLGNLLGNAARHARSDVEIEIEGDATELRIRVRDDGPGIPPEMMGRLFDRFVRDRSAGRMGLGLTIVQRIAERQRGSVMAYNRADREGPGAQGACFVVRLPKLSAA